MIDALLLFDGTPPNTGAAITTSRDSTNIIDMLAARDMGIASGIDLHVQILQTFTGGTSLQISLQGSATSGGTYYDQALSPVVPLANLAVGAKLFRIAWPADQQNNPTNTPLRWYKLRYTVVGTMTAGSVISYVTGGYDRQNSSIYGPGYGNNG